MCNEALHLEREARGGFFSTEAHNVFLEPDGASSAASSSATRSVQQSSSKLLFAADLLPPSSPLIDLYEWPPMLQFVRAALSKPELHLSADSMGRCYLNIFNRDDQLGWHFDNSEFSVSLIIQPASDGGAFEFAPDSRRVVEAMESFEPDTLDVKRPPLHAGDLYLFHGREALHRVSPVASGKRINAILTYNTDPSDVMNAYTRRKFFGRDLS